MRNLAALVIAAIGAVSIPGSADAEFLNGNELHDRCKDRSASCRAYIMGIADYWMLIRTSESKAVCIPTGVADDQLADVVSNYLTKHPERRHWAAAPLVHNAIIEAFPACRP